MTHSSQRFCLRWNNHQSNLLSVFDQLLHDESFVDVTIAVEGQLLRAHKMVLSACSPYFQALFVSHPDKHPIVILKDVPFADMRSLLDFMYRGEVSVDQDRLTAFLKVAESLRIKGLTEVNEEKCDLPSIASSLLSNQHRSTPPPAAPPPPPSLHRIHLTQPSSSASSSSSTTSSNAKRCASSPSNFNPYCGSNASAMYSQKRKRGRPRKLSGSSDTPSAASPEHEMNTDSDLRNSGQNFGDSPYGHGPPDLLEVNMTEHSQNSPSSFSEDHNIGSPEANMAEDDDCLIKTEPNEETGATAFQECKSPHLKDSPNSRSQSHTPTGQSERYPPDKCQWKEILKRLKKPEITIRVENNEKPPSEELSCGLSISAVVNDRKSAAASGDSTSQSKNNNSLDSFYNNTSEILAGSSSGSASGSRNHHDIHSWYSESHQQTGYFMDADGDDVDEEDEAMLKYEYESSRIAALANNSSSPGTGSGSGQVPAAVTVSTTPAASAASNEHSKPLDKSSVRRYCVQVAEHLFQCTLCYKTYTHISNFSRHFLSAHHGLRQEIPCPVCYRIFTRRDNMLTHMKQVHRITVTRGLATSLIQKLSAANEDLPMLRLVPKSELLAVYHKDSSGGSSLIKNDPETSISTSGNSAANNNSNGGGSLNHNSGSNANSSGNNTSNNINSNNNNKNNSSINNSGGGGANNNNSNFISNNNFLLNNSSSHFMLNNDMKFSPPPHLLSPQSNSSSASTPVAGDFSGTPPNKPAPTKRRVRRRATSSSDPAEQLTEMSVRGLNLFRYACIDEGVYKCLECAKTDIVKTFKNKYSFQRHAFLYHEGCQRKVFPCPVCGKEFSRPDKMKNHMKTVHDCFMPKEVMVPKDCIFPTAPTIPFFLSPP